ncbi:MAG: hypothetical protein H6730_22780 [Deltaproteobacteria bacterium]|nr:hypothetical protein [Deltaproteobacteria bacterium]
MEQFLINPYAPAAGVFAVKALRLDDVDGSRIELSVDPEDPSHYQIVSEVYQGGEPILTNIGVFLGRGPPAQRDRSDPGGGPRSSTGASQPCAPGDDLVIIAPSPTTSPG